MKKTVFHSTFKISEQEIPVKIYREQRTSVRASITKLGAILRMPIILTHAQEKKHREWFEQWLALQIKEREHLGRHFSSKSYQNGSRLKVGEREYQIEINYHEGSTHRASLKNGVITLQLSSQVDGVSLQKNIRQLLSRLVAKDFKPAISMRIRELNHLYFQKTIHNITLKYNHSNWGSCSHNGNINLSTRLLFAPDAVIDYVIIHELAHLIELNHSDRFWKIVTDVCPEYPYAEKWLKTNGHTCDF